MRTFHINLDLNRRGSREGHKPLQWGHLLFQIFVNFQTWAMTNKNKSKEEISYSKIYLWVGFHLIFIFLLWADKYPITLLT